MLYIRDCCNYKANPPRQPSWKDRTALPLCYMEMGSFLKKENTHCRGVEIHAATGPLRQDLFGNREGTGSLN